MDPDQTSPLGAVWSGSTLFAYMQNVSLKSLQEDAADDIYKQTAFSDADFLGALRVNTFHCKMPQRINISIPSIFSVILVILGACFTCLS